MPLHQSADLPYTITFAHRQAFFATVNRTLPTAALLTGGKNAVASVRDQPYMITFANRQAFSHSRKHSLYRLSHFLPAARLPLHQSADLPYTITFAHRQAFFATANRSLPTVTLSYQRQDCRCISPPTWHIRLLLHTDKPFSQP